MRFSFDYNKVAAGVLYAPEQAERRLRRNRYDTITEGIGIDRLTKNFDLGLEHICKAFQGKDLEAVEMAQCVAVAAALWRARARLRTQLGIF